jgi:5-methylcytosine-specific restriction endonuclease McrA
VYGLPAGQRCNVPLNNGVEFDHYPIPATEAGSATIDNCLAVCPHCHRHKTSHFDVPAHAKVKRVSDKHRGIMPRGAKLQSRGFGKAPPQRTATRPVRKWSPGAE